MPFSSSRDGFLGNTSRQQFQIGTIQSHFFQLSQALTQAGVVFEEGAVPSSSAALRGEKVEDLLEHQLVITGALSHLDWGDILSSPRKLEVVSVL